MLARLFRLMKRIPHHLKCLMRHPIGHTNHILRKFKWLLREQMQTLTGYATKGTGFNLHSIWECIWILLLSCFYCTLYWAVFFQLMFKAPQKSELVLNFNKSQLKDN